jgi:uncharacterized membrane protein YvbJ
VPQPGSRADLRKKPRWPVNSDVKGNMKISSAEDFDRLKSCIKCGEVFDQSDGSMLLPEATGMANAISRSIEIASGDTSKYKFMCFDCQRKIRIRKIIIWSALLFMLALIFVLTQLGIID